MLYDYRVSGLTTAPSLGRTLITILPAVWWVAQEVPSQVFLDWHHDPAFFSAYQVPAMLFDWIYKQTGWWGGQSYWVATQDAAVGFTLAVLGAVLLNRSPVWKETPGVRAAVAMLSVLLPWYPMIPFFYRPSYYAPTMYALTAAYSIAVAGAFVLPARPHIRASFIGVASAIGGSVVLWRMRPWEWVLSGCLLATFALLGMSMTRLLRNESVV